ncbi:hypothetical protein [Sulfitobacter aestuariivivens]|uniref:DUF1127 domain-containing protein n=1 Tax=Sulfitobacter aestuariivivens TaxID=2766981 RepID=A0A927D7I0_9RHOB|nr:hypothetical protein [Sulfitobacter aestuariivivens]MBD3664647.1 hypothetical protein [Sulfitobacter aestuariivivens]
MRSPRGTVHRNVPWTHANIERIWHRLTAARAGFANRQSLDLSHLEDHLVDDIGLAPDDPRLTPRATWPWVEYIPRG